MEYKKKIEKLLDNNQFKEILDSIYDGIYISDGKGKTLFINKSYTRITGIQKNEILGKNVKDILLENKYYKDAVTLDIINEKKKINKIGKILKMNKDILVSGNPIFDKEGNVELVVINNRDISELQTLQEELDFLRNTKISNKKLVCKSDKMDAILKLIKVRHVS